MVVIGTYNKGSQSGADLLTWLINIRLLWATGFSLAVHYPSITAELKYRFFF